MSAGLFSPSLRIGRDLAVPPDLLKFVNLKRYLEDVLGREVDLGMPTALKEGPAADNIRRDVQYL